MFEGFGKKEKMLGLAPETFVELYKSHSGESALADHVRDIADYLNQEGIAEQLLQEGAEYEESYIEHLRSIRRFCESQGYQSLDLGSIEALVVQQIGKEALARNEGLAAYVERVKASKGKFSGVEEKM